MLYQLPTGKTIELSFEEWDKMTDEDEQYLIAFGHGEEINNAFHRSVLLDKSDEEIEEDIEHIMDTLNDVDIVLPDDDL